MVENIESPLKVEIINVGKNADTFIPYRENAHFPVKVGGKVSFISNESEKTIYYMGQGSKNLAVNISNIMDSDIEVGKYNRETDDLDPGAPYVCKRWSQETIDGVVKETYDVLGGLNYSDDDLGLGQPAGNRFIIKLRNPKITSIEQIPVSPKGFIWISDGDTQTKVFGRDAFNEDGSLVIILNIKQPTSKVTIAVMWDKNDSVHHGEIDYSFDFTNTKFGKPGETFPDLQNVDIGEPQNIKISNVGEKFTKVEPYKENFDIALNVGEEITLTTLTAEETLYYLLQENSGIKVELV